MSLHLLNPFAHADSRSHLVRAALGISALAMIALPAGGADAQGPPSTATVRFGNPDAGTTFPPAANHDRSSNAKDNAIPRTVVISRGQNSSVTFEHQGRHQLAIYAPGTSPADINPAAFPTTPPCPPIGRVNDDDANSDRLFEGPPCPPNGTAVSTPAGLFSNPGRYLFICQVRPHFVDFDMYGWIIVQ